MRGLGDVVSWLTGLVPPIDGRLERPRRIDVAIAVSLGVAVLVEFPFLTSPYPGFALFVGLITAAAATYRRVKPLPVLLVAVALAMTGDILAGVTGEPVIGTVGGGLAAIVILYSVGRWSPSSTVIASLGIAGFALPVTGFLNSSNDPAWLWFVIEVVLTATTIMIGVLIRSNEVLKTQRARTALAEERNALANDIHDSVAHHMSAIAILAAGARQLDDPQQRDEAFDAIKQSASTGLTEVRQLITSIRSPDDMQQPLPGLGDLKQLVDESAGDSLKVDLFIDAAAEAVPVTVAAVAYAIAREALTNIRRHATGATRATVRTRTTDDYLDLTITDNGATPTGSGPDLGYGIKAMTERASSVGGNLSAGPDPTGGWLVASRLPLTTKEGQ